MYQVTKEVHKFTTYQFSREDIEQAKESFDFQWDVDNMTEKDFEELIFNVEGDYLENCCEIEVGNIRNEVMTVIKLDEGTAE